MKSRTAWPRIGLAGLIVLLIFAWNCGQLATSATLADWVRLHIEGLSPAARDRTVSPLLVDGDNKTLPLQRLGQTSYWFHKEVWFHGIRIRLPRNELANLCDNNGAIIVTIGDVDHRFSAAEVRSFEQLPSTSAPHPGDVLLKVPITVTPSSLPWVPGYANWPGDVSYLRAAVQATLLPAVFVGMLTFLWIANSDPRKRNWCRQVLGLPVEGPTAAVSPQSGHRWDWAGLVFLVCMLGLLEWLEPYYFTQGDNLIESLPVILVGCRSLWEGIFPDYNPYVLLGAPLANVGVYALTYPPMYFSYAVARHVLLNEYATLDVFAVLHLLAGFFLTRVLGRKLGMGAMAANLTALSFVLSGAALIMGRSWLSFMPVFVFLPWLSLGLVRLAAGPVSWGWILEMGLASGLIFHVGFPQLAVYVNGFFCLGVLFLLATRALPRQRLAAVLAALTIGAAVALPIVYQQWLIRPQTREEADPIGIAGGLAAMLFPYPLVEANPFRWGNVHQEYMGHFFFFGGLLAFFWLFQLAGLLFFRPERKLWPAQLWTFCGLIAFWLALGSDGLLWTLVSRLPIVGFINRFPFRMMPFAVFFIVLVGGMVLERWLGTLANRRRWELLTAIPALGLLVLHVAQCRTGLHTEPFRPYPDLPEHLQANFWKEGKHGKEATGRVCSLGRYVQRPSLGWQMRFNTPAVYGLPTPDGHNPVLVEKPLLQNAMNLSRTSPMDYLRTYGVRWFLAQPRGRWTDAEDGTANSVCWGVDVLSKADTLDNNIAQDPFPHVGPEDDIVLSELKEVDPLAFPAGNAKHSLPVRMHGQGIDVDVSDLAGTDKVIVNFLRYPDMQAFLDGKPAECFAEPRWHRIVVPMTGKAALLTIRYRPVWSVGLWFALATAAVGVGLGFVHRLLTMYSSRSA